MCHLVPILNSGVTFPGTLDPREVGNEIIRCLNFFQGLPRIWRNVFCHKEVCILLYRQLQLELR